MRIALLRAGAFLVNCGVVGGVALLCGAPWWAAVASCVLFFWIVWWGCGVTPETSPASDAVAKTGARVAKLMGAPPPARLRMLPGWTAAAVRARGGYDLLLGEEVSAAHTEAVLAHEVAHVTAGDIFWEPFTDGPARLLLRGVHRCAPLWILVFPFLVFAAPLARCTELRADLGAARALPSYPAVLKEVTSEAGGRVSLMYPTAAERVRRTARDSIASA